MKTYPIALSIATSDSGGCAGVQADLKTFSSLGVFGMSVFCALTAQNTCSVSGILPIEGEFVRKQLRAVFDDFSINAVKIGMIFTKENARIISEELPKGISVVLDPVMISTSGCSLIEQDTIKAMKEYLFPLATIITPNLMEAQALLEEKIDGVAQMKEAAKRFVQTQGVGAVLIKGGHLEGNKMVDVLCIKEQNEVLEFESNKIDTKNTHGTGCTLSSAIASHLAMGYSLQESVQKAKEYITNAIEAGKNVEIGRGNGPVNHFFCPQKLIIR